jgi:hypothetical protein
MTYDRERQMWKAEVVRPEGVYALGWFTKKSDAEAAEQTKLLALERKAG